jgi:hypothetical protein
MSPNLKSNFQIARLAADLRLRHDGDPVAAILTFCHKRVHDFLKEFRCTTLSELMTAAAARLDTLFIEIHDDDDLERVRREFVAQGEMAFATLADQLSPEVYAITFRRTKPRGDARLFASVIDCRGGKAWRGYFSKWHELAHLLTLTQQARLKFCRTHAEPETKDPEEALMDVIAGEVAFLPELVRPFALGDISFEKIDEIRNRLCPEASQKMSVIGLAGAWPKPCILIEARLALRARERRARSQATFDFRDAPLPVLRAVHAKSNAPAEKAGLFVPQNMRIPERSVISRVLADGLTSLEADEDLGWWESSSGRGLEPRPVIVKARRRWDSAEALILPR